MAHGSGRKQLCYRRRPLPATNRWYMEACRFHLKILLTSPNELCYLRQGIPRSRTRLGRMAPVPPGMQGAIRDPHGPCEPPIFPKGTAPEPQADTVAFNPPKFLICH